MTYRECYDQYLAALDSIKSSGLPNVGAARDAALLPLSCISDLAYDNHGYSYPVYIERKASGDVLWLVGAPSGWRLESLFSDYSDFTNGIAIDYGQNWMCVNFQEVLAAVMELPV